MLCLKLERQDWHRQKTDWQARCAKTAHNLPKPSEVAWMGELSRHGRRVERGTDKDAVFETELVHASSPAMPDESGEAARHISKEMGI